MKIFWWWAKFKVRFQRTEFRESPAIKIIQAYDRAQGEEKIQKEIGDLSDCLQIDSLEGPYLTKEEAMKYAGFHGNLNFNKKL